MSDNEAPTKHIELQRFYLKDVSFETPNSPQIFLEEWKPQIDLQLGTDAKSLNEEVFEVTLKITVTNKVGDKVAFLAEIHQAGIFAIKGFSQEELAPILGSYCPHQLFPYAREAISDLVTKGSFPQFLLAPVNFDAILAQHLQQQHEKQQGGASDKTAH